MPAPDAKPIVSTRNDDPDVEERIDAFVFALGDRIDGLQELELGSRFEPLREDQRQDHDLGLREGLSQMMDSGYGGAHWLASFATFALDVP